MRATENLPTLMTDHFLVAAAGAAMRYDKPFRHWRLRHLLPTWLSHAMAHLPVLAPAALATEGRRETNNATRRFLDARMQAEFGECATLAGAFQSPNVVQGWQRLCGDSLAGTYLRIEYCQDMGGFWLEPHTDIDAKRLTLLIYLIDPPAGECWGTDLLHSDGTLIERVTGEANSGVLFIPGSDTWHGFAPRPISGVRRTLIVNYVGSEWRARHELCVPDSAIET
jgi:hypothetical protein